jgi:Leucine-rich repeat (LRR) protein
MKNMCVYTKYYNDKKSRSKKAFEGLLQLITLNLSQNAIENIPTDAFFGLVSLRQMDLSNNIIEKLDNKTHSVFEDCLSLQEVSTKIILRVVNHA